MIRLGGFDWRHAAWDGAFYPDDLPAEWRLTFYANEFDALGLAPDAWLAPSLEELASWVADTRDGFRFYLELPTRPGAGMEARLKILAPRLGAILAGEGCPAAHIELAARFAPVWAEGEGMGLPRVAHTFGEALEPGCAPLLLLSAASIDLRPARRVMEALGPRDGVILLREDGMASETLQGLMTLRNLRNLLGWQ